MNDAALYEATIPPLKHYLLRMELLLSNLPPHSQSVLNSRLFSHSFTAAEHVETAIGFATRAVHPLAGGKNIETNELALTRESLIQLSRQAVHILENISMEDFKGASHHVIQHVAGTARLEQSATEFVTLFALPNFYFHFSCAFAILRNQGMDIGKADFDGQHIYPSGFHF